MVNKLRVLVLALLVLALPISLMAGNATIKGKVIDTNSGIVLPGANILIVGTTMGTITDRNGEFTLKNLDAGTINLEIKYIGYETLQKQIVLTANALVRIDLPLQMTILKGSEVIITANRAIERETPIAFTTLTGKELNNNYTTGDLPDIIKNVPGVWSSTAGLGESEMMVRGFAADKVQILINGIPVNDPESQHVYWSNWTGLSSDIQTLQVQRGVGSSLYGSGAFGGSFNIETMGVSPQKGLTVRSSAGIYNTMGIQGGINDGKDANGKGGFESYTPMNYNFSARYNTGLLMNGKIALSVIAERKAGNSYIEGTTYNGWSFGLETQAIFGRHLLLFSFIGAPQKHNQALTIQDLDLMKTLGREYNRYNHPYQENYYFKPQFSLRHEFSISKKQALVTNAFLTFGRGGGKNLRNDTFNVTNGLVGYQPVSQAIDNKYFGRDARFIYENTGVILTGYDPVAKTYEGEAVTSATNLITGGYNHSWQNDSKNNHDQFGINSYYQHQLNDMVKMVVGGDARYWIGDHYATSLNFRSSDANGNVITWNEVQRRYDYTTDVLNLSGFARATIKPMEKLTVQLDGQLARYSMKVKENPVEIFDFGTGTFTGKFFRTTMDMKNADGTPKFKASDYERVFNFFSPKLGANYNLTNQLNLMLNYSIANKEPKSYEWYNRDKGPGVNQPGSQELKPEQSNTIELGLGYRTPLFNVTMNLYRTDFKDKIESVTDMQGTSTTINAGKALHQGLELGITGEIGKIDLAGSATMARNRWQTMNVKKIFGSDASLVKNKVVPFAPEQMANLSAGYLIGKIHVGLGVNWWDEYYATYTNNYTKADGSVASSKLPYFFDLSANISYPIQLGGTNIRLRLDLNNITNRDSNLMRAAYSADFGRNDSLNSKYNFYVLQAPLFNAFFTTEISF